MGRKVSIGVVGSGGGLGTIVAGGSGNTLTTAVTNQNLVIDPNGTGITQIVGAAQLNAQSELRLADTDSSNYIALRAAGTMAANYTITWPAAVSGAGQSLTSDASGNLSWSTISAGLSASDPGASSTAHFVLFETNSGSINTSTISSVKNKSNLQFIPNSGELTATIGSFANVYGGTGSGGTVTIRGTSNGTKASASVLMTDNVASTTTTSGTLVVTGGLGVSGQLTATTLVETSSIAFKENINPIENALDLILKLAGVTYDRKDNKEHEAGLIAEDVYKIAPDLVSLDSNGNPYGVKYTKIGAYLIEAIKTIKEEINQLQGNK